ncbi:hypothetical protein B0H16DRAFT_1459159 [Mycena metata]|uniref:Uncharacterized protein n=1 Tax=Mycena metata TaxID=1033252 RepID=A0AAD7J484_9AGAR|nr:hypothetical protein B0H16DRAFT_1459159 [Mycena metata]
MAAGATRKERRSTNEKEQEKRAGKETTRTGITVGRLSSKGGLSLGGLAGLGLKVGVGAHAGGVVGTSKRKACRRRRQRRPRCSRGRAEAAAWGRQRRGRRVT